MFKFTRSLLFVLTIFFLSPQITYAQSPWPSENWSSAVNLTSVMSASGVTELSSLFWNSTTNRLYVSHGDGRLRVLQLNTVSNTFSQIANISYTGGPEGITQVNLNANEFYTIDEDNYQIRKYTHNPNFSPTGVTLSRTWNITASPSTMTNTGNVGPEGIAFVPDSFLLAIGFVSQHTGLPYTTSVKGMGGLMFIAHQRLGEIWVFDINPNVTNDFAFVGKYKTNNNESCDLAFERTTGLLYILHNAGTNSLEVTDLVTTSVSGGNRKFNVKNEYHLASPLDTNKNVEGFAITPKCNDSTNVSVWLCRDVESVEPSAYRQDCLRWYNPFTAPGSCANTTPVVLNLKVYIQGFYKGSGKMRAILDSINFPSNCDTITIELRKNDANKTLESSIKKIVDINGNVSLTLPATTFGNSYYIVIKHRHSMETWSASAILFNSVSLIYSFTDLINKAHGSNLKNLNDGNFGVYTGDTDQNGNINAIDENLIEQHLTLFTSGYNSWDLNGDYIVESTDLSLIENNVLLNIAVSRP
jgi:Dockerin type I domain